MRYVPFVIQPQTAPEDRRWFAGERVNLLHVGKFQPRKNHRLFLEVVSRLSERYPIRATVVGDCSNDGYRREFESVMRHRSRLGLDDTVDIRTNMPFSEVQALYANHDVFVLASRDEPAAVSPLEAMSHSLPVVCSDSNGTKCYVRPGENGFVFRTDDADDLEARLERIVKDRKRLVEMGRRSYELVISEHAPSRYAKALVEIATSEER